MGSTTLEEFLKPLSQALGREVPPQASEISVPDTGAGPHSEGGLCDLDNAALVEVFLTEAQALGIHAKRVSSAELGTTLANMAKELGAGEVVYADCEHARNCGLENSLTQAGLHAIAWDPTQAKASREAAESAAVGITFAFAGIAETGTVMQICNEGSGRSICLLPTAHIAVVDRNDVVPYMLQALERADKLRSESGMPSALVSITGPSSTSDIELVRVVGVHGPVATGVVVVDS